MKPQDHFVPKNVGSGDSSECWINKLHVLNTWLSFDPRSVADDEHISNERIDYPLMRGEFSFGSR